MGLLVLSSPTGDLMGENQGRSLSRLSGAIALGIGPGRCEALALCAPVSSFQPHEPVEGLSALETNGILAHF